ncbi:MAG: response regulator transcription factor, partial [Chitinophagaceae bacterium]
MKKENNVLTPVSRKDFSITFGGEPANKELDPNAFFANTIQQISKTAIGEYFWFVANTSNGTVHSAGGMLEKMMPFSMKDFVGYPPEILFKCTHPDDLPKLFAFTNFWINYFQSASDDRKTYLKPTIYTRLQNNEMFYNWMMVQYVENWHDENGNIKFGLTLVTNISHIKTDGEAMMSLLDTFDNSCQLFYCTSPNIVLPYEIEMPKLTLRELEVIRLLAAGFSSKQIATKLNIAQKTTDNHRQNLLHKTNTKSTGELVAYCIQHGFI